MDSMSWRVVASFILATLLGSVAIATTSTEIQSQPEQEEPKPFIEDVAPTDDKRFLDPTILINGLDYSFTSNFLPQDSELYTYQLEPMWAVNQWTAFWARVPINKLSIPNEGTSIIMSCRSVASIDLWFLRFRLLQRRTPTP
jgi:hypothetical protein